MDGPYGYQPVEQPLVLAIKRPIAVSRQEVVLQFESADGW